MHHVLHKNQPPHLHLHFHVQIGPEHTCQPQDSAPNKYLQPSRLAIQLGSMGQKLQELPGSFALRTSPKDTQDRVSSAVNKPHAPTTQEKAQAQVQMAPCAMLCQISRTS